MDSIQKSAGHYFSKKYLHRERWANYGYQLRCIFSSSAKSILEIGVGNGIVAETLRKFEYQVETADIDPALQPTHVASVTALPMPDRSFDLVLCAEVLEHLPFEESCKAMKELARVSRTHVLVTLPHAGSTFSFLFKIPLIHWQYWNLKIPHFWKRHQFDGQHYWEVGTKGYSRKRITRALEDAGLRVIECRIHPDDPSHVFYFCERAT